MLEKTHIKNMEKNIIFYVVVGLWIMQFILFKEQLNKEERVDKDNSLLLLHGAFLLCVILNVFISHYISNEIDLVKKISIFIIVKGIFIRYWAYYWMGDYFSRRIYPHKDRPLISNGPYRFARHPFHVGLFLITLGLCLFISGHIISFFIVFPIMGSVLHYRMSLEERLLMEKYGEIYDGWCRHRFRLFPFLY